MTTRFSLPRGVGLRYGPIMARVLNLSGCEGLPYTQKTSVAVGIAAAVRCDGPSGQDAGRRGSTDV